MVKTKLSTFGKIWRVVLCIAVPLGGGFLIGSVGMFFLFAGTTCC